MVLQPIGTAYADKVRSGASKEVPISYPHSRSGEVVTIRPHSSGEEVVAHSAAKNTTHSQGKPANEQHQLRVLNNRNLSRKDQNSYVANQKRQRRFQSRKQTLNQKCTLLEDQSATEIIEQTDPKLYPAIPPPDHEEPVHEPELEKFSDRLLNASGDVLLEMVPYRTSSIIPQNGIVPRVVDLSQVVVDSLISTIALTIDPDRWATPSSADKAKIRIKLASLLKMTKMTAEQHKIHSLHATSVAFKSFEYGSDLSSVAGGSFTPKFVDHGIFDNELHWARGPIHPFLCILETLLLLVFPWLQFFIFLWEAYVRISGKKQFAFTVPGFGSFKERSFVTPFHFPTPSSDYWWTIVTLWAHLGSVIAWFMYLGFAFFFESLFDSRLPPMPVCCFLAAYNCLVLLFEWDLPLCMPWSKINETTRFCDLDTDYVDSAPPASYKIGTKGVVVDLDPAASIKTRVGHFNLGFDSGPFQPLTCDSSKPALFATIHNRILQETPAVDKNFFNVFRFWALKNAKHFVGNKVLKPWDKEKVLNSLGSSPSTLAKLKLAYQELEDLGVDATSYHTKREIKRLLLIDAFPKREILARSNPFVPAEYKIRVIQGQKAALVARIAAYQCAFNERFSEKSAELYTSGMSPTKIAQDIADRVGYVYFSNDVEKWDASYGPEMADLSMQIFMSLVRDKEVNKFFRIDRHVGHLGDLRYERPSMKITGSLTTSTDNSLMNLLMHYFIYCYDRSCSLKQAFVEMNLKAQGDDDIGCHIGEPIDWKFYMKRLGFTSEAMYPISPYNLTFCSKIYTGETLIPFPGSVIPKLFNLVDPPPGALVKPMLRGIALGILANPRDALVDALVKRCLEILGCGDTIFRKIFRWSMRPSNHVEPVCSPLYAERYGLMESEVREICDSLSTIEFGDRFHPLLDIVFDRDSGAGSFFNPELPSDFLPFPKRVKLVEPPPSWFLANKIRKHHYSWFLSNKARNKLQYSLEGNDEGFDALQLRAKNSLTSFIGFYRFLASFLFSAVVILVAELFVHKLGQPRDDWTPLTTTIFVAQYFIWLLLLQVFLFSIIIASMVPTMRIHLNAGRLVTFMMLLPGPLLGVESYPTNFPNSWEQITELNNNVPHPLLLSAAPSVVTYQTHSWMLGIKQLEHHQPYDATPSSFSVNVAKLTGGIMIKQHRSRREPAGTALNMCNKYNEVTSSKNAMPKAVASTTTNSLSLNGLRQIIAERFQRSSFAGESCYIDTITGEIIPDVRFNYLRRAILSLHLGQTSPSDEFVDLPNPAPLPLDSPCYVVNWDSPPDSWSISNETRNKLAHALNGNTSNPLAPFHPGLAVADNSTRIVQAIKDLSSSYQNGGLSYNALERDVENLERDASGGLNYDRQVAEAGYDALHHAWPTRHKSANTAHSLSSKQKNKLAHAYNGNMPPKQKNRPKRAPNPRPKRNRPSPRTARTANRGRVVRTSGAPMANEVRTSLSKPIILRGREICTTVGLPLVTATATAFQPYLQEVLAGVPFNVYINPGNSDMFPLLSRESQVYEKFKIKKLSFAYISNTTTSKSGVIQMAIDYDALDTSTTGLLYNMRDLALLEGSCSETIWDPKALVLTYTPKKDDKKWFYVTELGQTGVPPHDKYPGTLQVYGSTPDGVQGATYGQLWVTYEIEFTGRKKPISTDASFVQWAMAGAATSITTTFQGAVLAPGSSSDFLITSNNILQFARPGRFAIHVRQVGTVITGAIVLDVLNAASGAITAVTLVDGTTSHVGITTGALTSHLYAIYDVAAPIGGASPSIRFTLGAATTTTAAYVSIHAVHSDFAALPPLSLEERLQRLETTQSTPDIFSEYPSEDECKNMTDSVLLKSVVARLSNK